MKAKDMVEVEDENIKGCLGEKREMEGKKKEKAHHFALHRVSRCHKREMKSEGCQVKESKTFASPLKWTEDRNGEGGES